MGRPERTRYLDDSTQASDPGRLALSHPKLRELRPDLYGLAGAVQSVLGMLRLTVPQKGIIKEALLYGDSRAAVVVSVSPLMVAAYTDELDCVALLRFPDALVQRYGLRVGTRLLTVNLYGEDVESGADLIPGPGNTGDWSTFHPIIAEFVSEDTVRIQQRKQQIPEEEWKRAYALGKEYLQQRPGLARDGRPGCSAVPAHRVRQIESSIRGEKQRAYLLVGCLGVLLAMIVFCGGILLLGAAVGGRGARGPRPVAPVAPPPVPPDGQPFPGPPPGFGPGELPPEIEEARARSKQRVAEMKERSRRAREEARRRREEARPEREPSPGMPGDVESRTAAPPDRDPSEPRLRTWTDASGQYHVEAELVEHSEGNVTLKKPDGQVVTLPLDKLSPADQEYVRSLDRP